MEGKDPEALHIVDVHMYRVHGELVFPHGGSQIQNLPFGIIAPFALVEAVDPFLLQHTLPRQGLVAAQDVLGGFPGNHVVIQRAVRMGPEIVVGLLFSEVEAGAEGIVRQNTQASVAGVDHKEIDGLVQAFIVITVGRGIVGIPVFISIVPLVQETRLVSQAVNDRVRVQGFHNLHLPRAAFSQGLRRHMSLRGKLRRLLRGKGGSGPPLAGVIRTQELSVVGKRHAVFRLHCDFSPGQLPAAHLGGSSAGGGADHPAPLVGTVRHTDNPRNRHGNPESGGSNEFVVLAFHDHFLLLTSLC